MSDEVRTRLVRVVAERLRSRFTVRVKSVTAAGRRPGRQVRDEFLPMSAERCAEVAVAAVLDEMSEGPLHDAMVRAGVRALNRLGGIEPDAEQDADIVLSAALSVARTWNEEEE